MTSGAGTRTGWGFDAHRLGGDPPLLLGGVNVSDQVGLVATSDGDVLAHAITDAILGACVLGDIGDFFPSDDPANIGRDSLEMLRRVTSNAIDVGWRPVHLDATVVVESVRVAGYRSMIRTRLADAIDLPAGQISVKATTTDGLGFIGEGQGVAAIAVVTVEPV